MKTALLAAVALAALSSALVAQERKPVPKDSVRVFLPGCAKGRVFTVGPRKEDSPGRFDIPEGMHLRMNGPKTIMEEIKAHEGSMFEVVGLMRKGQYGPEGVGIGGGYVYRPAHRRPEGASVPDQASARS